MTTPIDLFRIVLGTDIWALTSADTDQVYNDEYYLATAMGRGGFDVKNELSKANIEVRLPLDHGLADALLTSFGEQICTLTIFTDRDGDVETTWKGRLAGVQPDTANVILNFESIFTSLRRPGLRARFQKSCRHALYGRGCTLDPADFADAGTVTAITGQVLTIPEAGVPEDGYYTGGMVAAPDGTLSFIVRHQGTQITCQRLSYSMLSSFATLGSGMDVTLYPGCDHTRSTCHTKFSNRLNYGGFDWIPVKNPLGGSSIV